MARHLWIGDADLFFSDSRELGPPISASLEETVESMPGVASCYVRQLDQKVPSHLGNLKVQSNLQFNHNDPHEHISHSAFLNNKKDEDTTIVFSAK